MKIVIAAGIYPPDIGGPATYSELIAQEFTKKGIGIEIICYGNKQFTDDNQKFKIVRISRKHIRAVRYWLYLWNLLKIAKEADIIYAQGPVNSGLPAMLVSRILNKKFVVKVVGDYAWEQGMVQFGIKDLIEDFQNKKYNWSVEIRRNIQKMVVKRADIIITPGQWLKNLIKEWGIDGNKIKVIPNARPEIKKTKEQKKLTGDIIISAGRLVNWKGFDALIEIMPDLIKENPNFRLIIIGSGPEKEKLENLITKLNLKDKVRLINKVSFEDLIKYFKASQMFVLNSGYEGLPHIILEAMAANLPVIASDVCGNPEVVKDGQNGLLVEYNNKRQIQEAILKLWKDKDLRERLIKNSRQSLEKFELEKVINKTLRTLTL